MTSNTPKFEKRRPEPVQKGNPYRLTLNQHFFPRMSIERFYQKGGVEVHLKMQHRLIRCTSADPIFCAKRVWDQSSEQGFMLQIESTYQNLAERVLAGQDNLNEEENAAITDFYLLWNLRQRAKSNPPQFPGIPGWRPKVIISEKNEQERMEKAGIAYWNQEGKLPDHVSVGTSLQLEILAERERMNGTKWGIFTVKARNGEFLVPDRLSEHTALPLSPRICFVAGYSNRNVDSSFVRQYNSLAIANAEKFYFASHIKNCPIFLRAK